MLHTTGQHYRSHRIIWNAVLSDKWLAIDYMSRHYNEHWNTGFKTAYDFKVAKSKKSLFKSFYKIFT